MLRSMEEQHQWEMMIAYSSPLVSHGKYGVWLDRESEEGLCMSVGQTFGLQLHLGGGMFWLLEEWMAEGQYRMWGLRKRPHSHPCETRGQIGAGGGSEKMCVGRDMWFEGSIKRAC